uniref:Uncharacterized protein n=1 Tax=Coccidioides posadasii RMSCC 3488 TaxID=454284 RepID=A0A0J6F742_COCPO|nr:hypothetical protein CPAG_02349 [Coccidioides posadasii RMSCC 3488]
MAESDGDLADVVALSFMVNLIITQNGIDYYMVRANFLRECGADMGVSNGGSWGRDGAQEDRLLEHWTALLADKTDHFRVAGHFRWGKVLSTQTNFDSSPQFKYGVLRR